MKQAGVKVPSHDDTLAPFYVSSGQLDSAPASSVIDLTGLHILPVEFTVFPRHIAVSGSLFGDADRARIHICEILIFVACRDMCVAAQQNIALSERGRCFFSVMVTVGNKEFFVPDCMIGKFRTI